MNKKNSTKNEALKKLNEIRSRVKVEAKPAANNETKIPSTEQTTETDYKGVHIVR